MDMIGIVSPDSPPVIYTDSVGQVQMCPSVDYLSSSLVVWCIATKSPYSSFWPFVCWFYFKPN